MSNNLGLPSNTFLVVLADRIWQFQFTNQWLVCDHSTMEDKQHWSVHSCQSIFFVGTSWSPTFYPLISQFRQPIELTLYSNLANLPGISWPPQTIFDTLDLWRPAMRASYYGLLPTSEEFSLSLNKSERIDMEKTSHKCHAKGGRSIGFHPVI